MTLAERIQAAKAKPENERTPEEKAMLKAVEEQRQAALKKLKGE